jgi:hypothetical protein
MKKILPLPPPFAKEGVKRVLCLASPFEKGGLRGIFL